MYIFLLFNPMFKKKKEAILRKKQIKIGATSIVIYLI